MAATTTPLLINQSGIVRPNVRIVDLTNVGVDSPGTSPVWATIPEDVALAARSESVGAVPANPTAPPPEDPQVTYPIASHIPAQVSTDAPQSSSAVLSQT